MSTSEKNTKLYEALILLEQSAVANSLEEVSNHVKETLEKVDSKILTLHRWDERKLAYPIKKQARGTFLLALFEVQPQQIAVIEREFNLSDLVLRVMFISADHMGETEIEQTLEAGKHSAEKIKLQAQEAENQENEPQEETEELSAVDQLNEESASDEGSQESEAEADKELVNEAV